jgi:hypothetical protein
MNKGQPVTDNKELRDKSGLGDTLSVYSLFSVFLEWKVLDSIHPDLTCIPVEYIDYIASAVEDTSIAGEIIHLMMLFSEHAQLQKTGNRKIFLEEEKYKNMAEEFSMFCALEGLRRTKDIQDVFTADIFNPNMKTTFFIDGQANIPEKTRKKMDNLNITIQESAQT